MPYINTVIASIKQMYASAELCLMLRVMDVVPKLMRGTAPIPCMTCASMKT